MGNLDLTVVWPMGHLKATLFFAALHVLFLFLRENLESNYFWYLKYSLSLTFVPLKFQMSKCF